MAMRVVCAWCKKDLGTKTASATDDTALISHGICPDCARNVLGPTGKSLDAFLDTLPGPVLAVDGDARVISANTEGYLLLKKKPAEVRKQLGGDVFECRWAKTPGGCGRTTHCKSCTIRLTVTDTAQTGRSHFRREAYPDLFYVTKDLRVRFLISTEKVGEAVLLRIDEVKEESAWKVADAGRATDGSSGKSKR
jgi:hypothetical protein